MSFELSRRGRQKFWSGRVTPLMVVGSEMRRSMDNALEYWRIYGGRDLPDEIRRRVGLESLTRIDRTILEDAFAYCEARAQRFRGVSGRRGRNGDAYYSRWARRIEDAATRKMS